MLVRAAGGLVGYLVRQRVLNELAQEGAPVRLPGGARLMSLRDFMHIDALSIQALNIFAPDERGALGTDGGKGGRAGGSGALGGGFSVFALLDRTVAPAGRRVLRSWCQRPSLDLEVLQHRHDAVEFLVACRSAAPDVWRDLRSAFKGVKDCLRVLTRIKRVRATPTEWSGLMQTLLAATMVSNVAGVCTRQHECTGHDCGHNGVPWRLSRCVVAVAAFS
jgi:DNA mismatch repair protein MSH5